MSVQTLFSDPLRASPEGPGATETPDKTLLEKCAHILWKATGMFESLENRRHVERGPDPDYSPPPSLRIENYHERPPSWQKWILGIVGLITATGIPGAIWELSLINSRLSSIETHQVDSETAMAQRTKALEDRTLRLEGKVFR